MKAKVNTIDLFSYGGSMHDVAEEGKLLLNLGYR